MSESGPVDAYLDRLLASLRGRPGDVRRILSEAETHLRDAAAEGVASGLSPDEAERAAVARFGPVAAVAPRFGLSDVLGARQALGQLIAALVLLGAVGFLAIGASGVLSLGMRAAWGDSFVAGDQAGVAYTADRCDDFRYYHPEAGTCRAAAAAHHADEVVEYRGAAGVLGLGLLGGWMWYRRRSASARSVPGAGLLPEGLVAAVGAIMFGGAGALLTVDGLGELLGQGRNHGPGQWLSGGIVALAVALWFARDLIQVVVTRTRTATTTAT